MGQRAARSLRSGVLRGRGTLDPHVPRRRLGFLFHLVERPVVHVDDEGVLLRVGRVARHVPGVRGVSSPRGGSGVDDDGSTLFGRGGGGTRAMVQFNTYTQNKISHKSNLKGKNMYILLISCILWGLKAFFLVMRCYILHGILSLLGEPPPSGLHPGQLSQ